MGLRLPDRRAAAHAETVRDMNLAQLASLRPELGHVVRHFDARFQTCWTRRHLRTFLAEPKPRLTNPRPARPFILGNFNRS